jgi:hypothetical protein
MTASAATLLGGFASELPEHRPRRRAIDRFANLVAVGKLRRVGDGHAQRRRLADLPIERLFCELTPFVEGIGVNVVKRALSECVQAVAGHDPNRFGPLRECLCELGDESLVAIRIVRGHEDRERLF